MRQKKSHDKIKRQNKCLEMRLRMNRMKGKIDFIEITDLQQEELAVYTKFSEVQLLHLYEPEEGIFIAESPKVIIRALDAGYEPVSMLMEAKQAREQSPEITEVFQKCETKEAFPVYTASADVLVRLTGFRLTRGMLCAMRRKKMPSVQEICAGARRVAVLEGVVNPTNVGAIFRSAAALGMDAVLLTHECSDPFYRRAARVSMGTVFQIPWTYFGRGVWPGQGIDVLRKMGFQTAAMALREDAVAPDAPKLRNAQKLAVVLGTEGDGLAADTIADCDYTVCIPMAGEVDSLNVAAASAVAFWELGGRSDVSLEW